MDEAPSISARLATIAGAQDRNQVLIARWMSVAEGLLASPDKFTGRELNRTGEMLLAAGAWLNAEQLRLEKAARLAAWRRPEGRA